MKKGEDVSTKPQQGETPLAIKLCKNETLYPNCHKFQEHILMDLLLIYYFGTQHTIGEVALPTTPNYLLLLLDRDGPHTEDQDYDKYA